MAVTDPATLEEDLKKASKKVETATQATDEAAQAEAAGTTLQTSTQSAQATDENTTDVSKIAADIASQDSTIMQRARTEGLQQANSRGLLNSSMAVGEAQGAVLDQAVSMASQTSDQRHQTKLSEQEYKQASELSKQDYQQTSSLSEQEAKQEYDAIELAASLEEQMKVKLAAMEIDAEESRAAESMITSMLELYQEEVRSINSNPDIGSSERADMLAAAGELVSNEMDMIENLYGIDIDWETGDITYSATSSDDGNSDSSNADISDAEAEYLATLYDENKAAQAERDRKSE